MTHRALLIYSTGRGQTRHVCHTLARACPAVALLELTADPPELSAPLPPVVVLASPTYGQGDLHHRWLHHLPGLVPALSGQDRVQGGLLVLGDRRFHGRTYAGAACAFQRHLLGTPLAPLTQSIHTVDIRADPSWMVPALRWLSTVLAPDPTGDLHDDH